MILRAVQDAQCNTKNHRNSLFIMIVIKFDNSKNDNDNKIYNKYQLIITMIIIFKIILTIKIIIITLMMKILKVCIHGLFFLSSLLQL